MRTYFHEALHIARGKAALSNIREDFYIRKTIHRMFSAFLISSMETSISCALSTRGTSASITNDENA